MSEKERRGTERKRSGENKRKSSREQEKRERKWENGDTLLLLLRKPDVNVRGEAASSPAHAAPHACSLALRSLRGALLPFQPFSRLLLRRFLLIQLCPCRCRRLCVRRQVRSPKCVRVASCCSLLPFSAPANSRLFLAHVITLRPLLPLYNNEVFLCNVSSCFWAAAWPRAAQVSR